MQHQMDSLPRFDPTRKAVDEKFRTWALNSSSPTNLFPSKVLCPYLEQGTTDDCPCLAPQQLKPCSASTCRLVSSESRASSLIVPASEGSLSPGLPLGSLVSSAPLGSQPPRASPSSTGLPSTADTIYDLSTPSLADARSTKPSSDSLPSGQSTIGPREESPEEFFTAALGGSSKERVKRLVDVVQGFSKAKDLSNGLHESFWSEWPRVFGPEPKVGVEAESTPKTFEAKVVDRLRRLEQIRQKIRKGDWEANRLWLICLAHEVEHISQWDGIDAHTSLGFGGVSAAVKMVEEYLGPLKEVDKKSKNIVQVMKEGGPAALLLDDGGRPPSTWERVMTLGDIHLVFAYKRDRLPHLNKQTRSHDHDASCAIWDCFLAYGWSSWELEQSSTKVILILRLYRQHKRSYSGGGLGDSEPTNKRWRPETPASRPNHDFPATSLDQFSLGSIDQATSSGIDNTVELMPGSNSLHPTSFDSRNRTRDLTDFGTMGNLDYAFNSSNKLIDHATASILGYTVNSQGEFTDLATTSNLGYTINNSFNITDLDTTDLLQSTHDQSINPLPDTNYETDPPAVELLQWTVNGSDALTDPSTKRFLQKATSPTQLYLMNNFIYPSHGPTSPERKHTRLY